MIDGRMPAIVLILFGASCRTAQEQNPPPEQPSTPEQGWVATRDYQPRFHLRFKPPADWIAETPADGAHWCQYRLPGPNGSFEHATVIVDYFGVGGRGDPRSNLLRWAKMFEASRAADPESLQWVSSSAGCGWYTDSEGNEGRWCQITSHAEFCGTYLGDPSDETARIRKDDWCLVAVLHNGAHDSGPYYLELLGPASEVDRWRLSFRSFVDGAKPDHAALAKKPPARLLNTPGPNRTSNPFG